MALTNSFGIEAVLNVCSALKERRDFTGSSLQTIITVLEQWVGPIKLKFFWHVDIASFQRNLFLHNYGDLSGFYL